jgi:hypothetical protein
MEPCDVLVRHLGLCEDVHALLLEENTWLKTQKTSPEESLIERKKAILPKLDESLSNLKRLQPELFSPFDDSKKLVNESHSKLLQIFYLDRENEELLLKLSQPVERASFNRFAETDQIDEFHGRGGTEPPPETSPEPESPPEPEPPAEPPGRL